VYPPGFAVAVISKIERNLDKNSSNVFCSPIAPVNRYRQALAFLYDAKFDAKAPSDVNKAGTPATNTPGRRQTRARGMQ
jgi:rod shape-determining protein MreC